MAGDTQIKDPGPPRRRGTAALVYRLIGFAALGLATAGVFLPLLPTTVFLLVALWAFAKGSPEWADKVRANRRFGPMIRDWEARGAIPVKAKALAVVMMLASWSLLAATSQNTWLSAAVGVLLVGVAGFILTRPST